MVSPLNLAVFHKLHHLNTIGRWALRFQRIGDTVIVTWGDAVAVGSNGVSSPAGVTAGTVGGTGVTEGVTVIAMDDMHSSPSGVMVQTGVGSDDCAPAVFQLTRYSSSAAIAMQMIKSELRNVLGFIYTVLILSD